MRKQWKFFNQTIEFEGLELICFYILLGTAVLNAIALALVGIADLIYQEIDMTDGEKALETLIWVEDYIKELPLGKWNEQTVIYTILERVETVLKGMSNGGKDIR